jgi:alpha-N-arabinofuranosidase
LGREVFLTPVQFHEDGFFTAGTDGTTDESYEIKGDFEQVEKREYTFENTDFGIDWCFIRHPHEENYSLGESVKLIGTECTLNEIGSPTFIGMRQKDFCMELSCDVNVTSGECGVTMYMSETAHYDIAVCRTERGFEAALKFKVGNIRHTEKVIPLESGKVKLIVRSDNYNYNFYVNDGKSETNLGTGRTKYLSSEVDEGFTGVMTGLYAVGGTAEFTDYHCLYR